MELIQYSLDNVEAFKAGCGGVFGAVLLLAALNCAPCAVTVFGLGGRGWHRGKMVRSEGVCVGPLEELRGDPCTYWYVLWTSLGLYLIISWGSGIFLFSSRKQEYVERLRNFEQELDDCNGSYNQKNLPATIEIYESDTSEYTRVIVFTWIFTVLFAVYGLLYLIQILMKVGKALRDR